MSIVWVHELNTSEDLKRDVAPGSQKFGIVRKFQVLTDSMSDSSPTVANANDGSIAIPWPFEVYSKGTSYLPNLVATTCDCKRVKKQPLLWNVVVGYTDAPDFDLGGGQQGQDDLTCFLPSARSWKVSQEHVIWKGRLQLPAIGGNPAENYAAAMAKAVTPIVNSCNKLFADGIIAPKHVRAWEIRRYEWFYREEQADEYQDVVNEDAFWGHDPGTVKMVAITGDWQTVNNTLIWLVTYEFHICSTGWGEDLMDNGMEVWCQDDLTAPSVPADATGNVIIKDKGGSPVSAPVLLDGQGYIDAVTRPLDPDGDPIVVTWHHLEQKLFASIVPTLPTRQSLRIM